MSHKAGTVLGSVAATVLSIASPSLYADSALDGIRHSTTVHYADLNLNQPAGVAELYRRITVAANMLCGPRAFTGFYYLLPDSTPCSEKAIASAVARADRPQLTAYYHDHAARSGSQEIASRPSR
jgi:UrcA family protein